MSTLAEIEAAADQLPVTEQEALLAHLSARLARRAVAATGERVKLPLVECGPPGSLPIKEELIARVEIEHDVARENLASTMDQVCADHSPIVITRCERSVVMLSLEDYESLEETAYLMRSPANARRLLESMHALEAGNGLVRAVHPRFSAGLVS
jgi:antitoxin YefM